MKRFTDTRRPKYACRTCEKTGAGDTVGIIQAPARAQLIEGGLPTEATVADGVVSKYAWHRPPCRQSQQMATDGFASIARRSPIGSASLRLS